MKKILFIFLIVLAGCYYDNEEELYPEGSEPCDTTNVTFSGTVFPIIQSNCFACHGVNPPQGNILLDSYANIANYANIAAGQPGSLYGAISHGSGNSPMPKNGNKLSDCNIRKIKIWIDAGTPDN